MLFIHGIEYSESDVAHMLIGPLLHLYAGNSRYQARVAMASIVGSLLPRQTKFLHGNPLAVASNLEHALMAKRVIHSVHTNGLSSLSDEHFISLVLDKLRRRAEDEECANGEQVIVHALCKLTYTDEHLAVLPVHYDASNIINHGRRRMEKREKARPSHLPLFKKPSIVVPKGLAMD